MATKQLNSRVRLKKDTAANWTSNNPVLLDGEVAIVVTNANEIRFKIGDGTSSFTALPYQDEFIQNAINDVDDGLIAHETDTGNPHSVTKSQVGLGNVDNVRQFSANNPPPYPVTSVNGTTGAVNLDASDVGARPDTWVPTLNNLGITATASELNKLDGATVTTQEINYLDGVSSSIQTQLNGKVPTARTVNGKALSSNITLSAADVSAVPTSRTVNGKPLSSNITLSASDVGALSTAGGTLTGNLTGRYLTGTWLQSTAVTGLNSNNYRGICVFDNSGWVYFRTKEQILEDIGANASSAFNSEYKGTLPTSGWVSSNGQYYYQVTISDMVSSSIPLVIPQWTSNKTNEKSAWSTLTDVESFNGYVRFYAPSPIATAVPYTLLYTNYDSSVITLVNRAEGTEVTGTFTPA